MGLSKINTSEDETGVSRVSVSQGGPGSTTLKNAAAGTKHRVEAALLTLSADGTLQFLSDGNALTGPMDIAAKGGFMEKDLGGLVETNPGEALVIATTGGAARGVVRVRST